jgi:hypothetical protein
MTVEHGSQRLEAVAANDIVYYYDVRCRVTFPSRATIHRGPLSEG